MSTEVLLWRYICLYSYAVTPEAGRWGAVVVAGCVVAIITKCRLVSQCERQRRRSAAARADGEVARSSIFLAGRELDTSLLPRRRSTTNAARQISALFRRSSSSSA